MARQGGLHLISPWRAAAAVYAPYEGPYQGHGPRRKYDAKLNDDALPDRYLKQTLGAEQIEPCIYQADVLHKDFAQPLHVVIIVKRYLTTQAQAHGVLASSARALPADTLLDYDSWRCHIEFPFRDATQYWGLEDFMNVTAPGVTNAAKLALFMGNVVYVLLRAVRRTDPHCSVLDLKAYCRGYTYVTDTIKLLPDQPDEHLGVQIFRQVARLGRIHPTGSQLNAA
jgi:putative transposase